MCWWQKKHCKVSINLNLSLVDPKNIYIFFCFFLKPSLMSEVTSTMSEVVLKSSQIHLKVLASGKFFSLYIIEISLILTNINKKVNLLHPFIHNFEICKKRAKNTMQFQGSVMRHLRWTLLHTHSPAAYNDKRNLPY